MTDYIERGGIMALIEAEERLWGEDYDARQILGDIENYPAAEVRPVARGEWVVKGEDVICSACGAESAYNAFGASHWSKYCPNCGALNKEDKG